MNALTYLNLAALAIPSIARAEAHGQALPPIVPQANAEITTFEHLDALNECDWERLMAQFPEDVLFILLNGVTEKGRAAIGDLFAAFCLPRSEGGFVGAKLIPEIVRTVGDTINVSWRQEADWGWPSPIGAARPT